MSRRPKLVTSAALVLMAGSVAYAPPAGANGFGPPCCYHADNANHTYYNNQLTQGVADRMDYAMGTRLESTDMTTDKFQSFNGDTDIVAYDTYYGTDASHQWWGLYTCEATVASDPTKCNQAYLRFNLSWGTPTTAVTCHEVGHSVGLDHSSLSTSCMQPVAGTANDFDTHDRSHINDRY